MKYTTIIPDNTPEEEVVMYHLRGNALSRSEMINYCTNASTKIGTNQVRYYCVASDAQVESLYNMLYADEIYFNSR